MVSHHYLLKFVKKVKLTHLESADGRTVIAQSRGACEIDVEEQINLAFNVYRISYLELNSLPGSKLDDYRYITVFDRESCILTDKRVVCRLKISLGRRTTPCMSRSLFGQSKWRRSTIREQCWKALTTVHVEIQTIFAPRGLHIPIHRLLKRLLNEDDMEWSQLIIVILKFLTHV